MKKPHRLSLLSLISLTCILTACTAPAAAPAGTTVFTLPAAQATAEQTTMFPFTILPTSPPAMYSLGATATLDNWHITVSSYNITDSASDVYQAFTPASGDLYVMAAVSVRNAGGSAAIFLPSFSYSDDATAQIICQGKIYPATQLLGYSQDIFDSSLDPGAGASGVIAFEMPAEAANSGDLLLEFVLNQDSVGYRL